MKKSGQPFFSIYYEIISVNSPFRKKAFQKDGKYFCNDIVQGSSFKAALQTRTNAMPSDYKQHVRFLLQEECIDLGFQVKM